MPLTGRVNERVTEFTASPRAAGATRATETPRPTHPSTPRFNLLRSGTPPYSSREWWPERATLRVDYFEGECTEYWLEMTIVL
jgi:hypothetical protein